MVKILTPLFALSLFFNFAQAAEPCENYAKYYAIKDYKKRVGTVQGSDGIQYESEFISVSDEELTFKVSIQDNNEDGERWTVVYEVVVAKTGQSSRCSLVKLTTSDLED